MGGGGGGGVCMCVGFMAGSGNIGHEEEKQMMLEAQCQ